MRILIAGGGTAGHVTPAVAVAEELGSDDVLFVGTKAGVEARMVPARGIPLETIDVTGFDRARPHSVVTAGARALSATGRLRVLVKRFRPHAVLGMGGYVSFPACAAARSCGVPVVLHEQNIVLGLANRVLKPLAQRVAVSFRETLAMTGRKGVYTGNPVRRSLVEADLRALRPEARARFGLDPGRKTLLVFGGSQGAASVNEAALGLGVEWEGRTDLQVLHVAGTVHWPELPRRAARADGDGLVYRIVEYVEDMEAAYAASDLALCRGGASTVAELTVVGLPSIVVPYPHHRDRQQERHARVLQQAGAAAVLLDSEVTARRVASLASEILLDDHRLDAMRRSGRTLGRPDAAARVASVLREVAA